jgi:hypothetical protein
MTLAYKFPFIQGTVSDRTGGTWTNLAAGWFFAETERPYNTYYWNGTAWVRVSEHYGLPRNIIYVDAIDGLYKFRNTETGVVTSSSSVNTCFSNAFSSGSDGFVEVREGIYPITGVLTGIRLRQHVFLSKGAIIQVPNGYTGVVFSLNNNGGARHAILEGGQIVEDTSGGAAQRLWTAVELNSTTAAGVCFNHVKNMEINDAGTAFLLKCDGSTSFVNANTISNVNPTNCKIFADFQLANSGTKINANLFQDFRAQADANVDYGFKNVTGVYNSFIHCYVYDISLDGTAISMNILSSAQDTVILGGFVDHQNFSDLGIRTMRYTKESNSIGTFPSGNKKRKSGIWQGISEATTAGEGLLSQNVSAVAGHTATQVKNTTVGQGRNYATTTTITTNAGWKLNSTITIRGLNPYYRAFFRLGSSTLMRFYMGFHTSGVDLTGDDPLNAQAGVMLGCRSGDTNAFILHNDTSGATVFEDTGVTVASLGTGLHKIEIRADDANTKFLWSLDNSAFVSTNLTTNIPAQTTSLCIQNEVQTNESGVAKNFDLLLVEVEHDSMTI